MRTDSEILVSAEHIDPKKLDGYVVYKLGSIKSVAEGRGAAMLWNNSVVNSRMPRIIPFVNTNAPTIPNYNVNYAAVYGQSPRLDLIVIDENGNDWDRKLDSTRHKTGGLITHITYDLSENYSGYIIIS